MSDTSAKATHRISEALASIGYNLRVAWSAHKLIAPVSLLNQLLKVAIPFIAIFLPKLVIDALTAPEPNLESLLHTLSFVGIALFITNTCAALCDNFINENAYRTRSSVGIRIYYHRQYGSIGLVQVGNGEVAIYRCLIYRQVEALGSGSVNRQCQCRNSRGSATAY